MDYAQDRINREILSSSEGQKAMQIVTSSRPQPFKVKSQRVVNKAERGIGREKNRFHSKLNKRLKSRKLIRASGRAVVVENQPIYTHDKDRFFHDAVKEERRQLFFS